MKLLGLVMIHITRNRTRSFLTIGGVCVAILLFCFFYSVDVSLSTMIGKSSGSQNLIVQQEGHW